MKMIQHLALSCVAMVSLSTAFTNSRAEVPSQSLRAQAILENNVPEVNKKNTTNDGRVEGMLSLKDPRLEVSARWILYSVQLSAQQFQPSGTVRSDLGYTFDLQQSSVTVMPGLTFGFIIPAFSNNKAKLRVGLAGKINYSNQSTNVVFPSGYAESEVRLSSLILAANPYLNLTSQSLDWLSMNWGLEYGDISYTQSSSNDLASFTKRGGYKGWNTGLNFQLSEKWALTSNYAQRKMTDSDNNSIQIQSNNYEVGTQVTW